MEGTVEISGRRARPRLFRTRRHRRMLDTSVDVTSWLHSTLSELASGRQGVGETGR